MDADGVDMQLLSPNVGFYQYFNDLETTKAIARECNDEIAEMIVERPDRFAGIGTVPMQDVPSAIAEMERGITELGLSGVIINDSAAGETYDDLKFLPFFKAAEEMGAIILFHQGGGTIVDQRIDRYKLGNSVGNLTERALVFGALVYGGVMDKCPDLKPLLAHGGGVTPYCAVRMDKASGALDRTDPSQPLTPRFDRAARRTLRAAQCAQRLPQPVPLRLLHLQRRHPALLGRRSRHRSGGPGHRHACADGSARSRQLDPKPRRAQ